MRMLEILEDELTCAMGLTGLTSIDKVTSKYVCPAEPVSLIRMVSHSSA